MRRVLILLFSLIYCASLVAQSKHSFTFEDMMKLKRVGSPRVSPDGKWVLFSAVDVDLAANTRTPHIWVVPTAGGQEQEIISDQDADQPRWAPDGKRFLFISNKEGGSQVWVADFDRIGGKVTGVHQLTSISTEADGPIWSPDGKNIVFVSNVYPECDGAPAEEQACNAKKLDEVKNSKVKALIFTHLLYRHWTAYKEGKRSHLLVVSVDGGTGAPARDLTPGDYDAPVFSLGGQDLYAFSSDGQELCYTSNHDPVPAISTNNDLWTVPVNIDSNATPAQVNAQTKNITADNKASDSTPLYSPDGKYIAYLAQKRPGYESDRFRLMLYDRKTGEKKNLTENFDRWVGSFDWAGQAIYLTAENEGEAPIYWIMPRLCLDGCYPIKIADGYDSDIAAVQTKVVDGQVTTHSDVVLFSQISNQFPTQIFAIEHGSCAVDIEKMRSMLMGESKEPLPQCAMSQVRKLTRLDDALLSQISMSPLESFWFTGAYGDKVQGFLVKPPNFDPDQKYPVKFIVHGGPEGPMGRRVELPLELRAVRRQRVRGHLHQFHGSPGYGQKFIDAINGDWGGDPFEDLMKGLDYAEQHYPFIDKDRECALGASYGGYMANWILGHTNRFKCIVSHDGMFNSESAWGTTEELWFNEWEFKGTPLHQPRDVPEVVSTRCSRPISRRPRW